MMKRPAQNMVSRRVPIDGDTVSIDVDLLGRLRQQPLRTGGRNARSCAAAALDCRE